MGLCYRWVNWTTKQYLDPQDDRIGENAKHPYGPRTAQWLFLLFRENAWKRSDEIGLTTDADDDPWWDPDLDGPDGLGNRRPDWQSVIDAYPWIASCIADDEDEMARLEKHLEAMTEECDRWAARVKELETRLALIRDAADGRRRT